VLGPSGRSAESSDVLVMTRAPSNATARLLLLPANDRADEAQQFLQRVQRGRRHASTAKLPYAVLRPMQDPLAPKMGLARVSGVALHDSAAGRR
jgi:hypothetical protein